MNMIFGHDVFNSVNSFNGETNDEVFLAYYECRITADEAVDKLVNLGYERADAVEQINFFTTECDTSDDEIPGCTDPEANNYNPNATEDNSMHNLCTYDAEPVPGCTDEDALNYNEEATEDDDSCEYEEGMFSGFEDWQLAVGAVVLLLLLK